MTRTVRVAVEPHTIHLGDAGTGTQHAGGAKRAAVKRRLRRLLEPAVLVVVALMMLFAVRTIDRPSGPDGGPAPRPVISSHSDRPSMPVGQPRFVAPETAAPGERITVMAFRNRRLCGLAELRFDGMPVANRLDSYVGGQPDAGWMEMFLTMDVPQSASPGPHEIQLYGPVPGGFRDAMCADVHEHQGVLAAATIVVSRR